MVAKAPTDASVLSFRLPMVVGIVVGAASIVSTLYVGFAGIRSDIRDMSTRMEAQTKLFEAQSKLQEERADTLKEAVAAIQRRQELQQYEIQGLKEAVMTQKPK